ncbi:DUF5994 family protein [Streptosporangium algeriense]|uniref:DUF5994 family protein n=1 Tax=Streptosporangium algeriense TaxID=1682748 RepID=A0ABW3DXD9_9ACTN
MTPTVLLHLKPLGSAVSTVPTTDPPVRLCFDPVLDRYTMAHGVWWPYSHDAAAELPGLIAAVDQRFGQATLLVSVYHAVWENIPYRVPARGRQVRVSCLRRGDPQVVVLSLTDAEHVVLLVVEPDTAHAPAPPAPTRHMSGTASADALAVSRLPTTPSVGAAHGDHSPGRLDETVPANGRPAVRI